MRRRPRFGLRLLLLIIAAMGVSIAWPVIRARDQGRAVGFVKQYRGDVSFDVDDIEDLHRPRRASASVSTWIRSRLGEDYFRRVVAVSFRDESRDPMPSEKLRLLTRLPALKRLRMFGEFGERHLAEIARIPGLEQLQLGGPGVTDALLVHLDRFPRLKILTLSETSVTDAGLIHLRGLVGLEELTLQLTPTITGPGLGHLASLTRLRRLCLFENGLDDDDMHRLVAFPALRALILGEPVTDDGMAWVARIPGLEELHLAFAPVSAAGVELVLSRTRLAKLAVQQTLMSREQLKRVMREHPSIDFGDSD